MSSSTKKDASLPPAYQPENKNSDKLWWSVIQYLLNAEVKQLSDLIKTSFQSHHAVAASSGPREFCIYLMKWPQYGGCKSLS